MTDRYLTTLFILVLSILPVHRTEAQSLADPELKVLFNPADTLLHDHAGPLRASQNEIDVTVSVLFLFYKTFISSQDIPSCIFTPSCSVYAVEALQNKGLLPGFLNTFDRLSRCHGLVKQGDYPYNKELNRFYDPVW